MTQVSDSRKRLYERYVSTHVVGPGPGRRFTRYFPVLNGLPDDRSAKVVDIGCGSGELVAEIVGLGYRNVCGVDISAEQVALAHQLNRPEVELGDVRAYLVAHPGYFNAITATDVLEHFDRDEVIGILDDIYAGLSPGGVLVAQVPNATSPFFGNYAFGDFTHRSVFTARSAQQICRSAGFESVAVYPVNPHAHGVRSGLRRAAWAVMSSAFKLSLAIETGQLRGHLVTQNVYFVATKCLPST